MDADLKRLRKAWDQHYEIDYWADLDLWCATRLRGGELLTGKTADGLAEAIRLDSQRKS